MDSVTNPYNFLPFERGLPMVRSFYYKLSFKSKSQSRKYNYINPRQFFFHFNAKNTLAELKVHY